MLCCSGARFNPVALNAGWRHSLLAIVGWTALQPYVLMAIDIAIATAVACPDPEATAIASAVAICAFPPTLEAEAIAEAAANGEEVARAEA